MISIFGRIEVRYDCVWTGACSIFDSANAYPSAATGSCPKRLIDARRTGYEGTNKMATRGTSYDIAVQEIAIAPTTVAFRPDGERQPMRIYQTPFLARASSTAAPTASTASRTSRRRDRRRRGAPGHLHRRSALDLLQHSPHSDCARWGARNRQGSQNGRGTGDTLLLSPNCNYEQLGAAADVPNPFRSGDFNPLIKSNGAAALPYRPAPMFDYDSGAPLQYARGHLLPELPPPAADPRRRVRTPHKNFRRAELAWNRGQSQQSQKELKELYVDFEMFDSQLFVRAGYQTIVWGKTELFRNQDQFNPQDVGLASLPSLEESRISPVVAARDLVVLRRRSASTTCASSWP